MEWSEQNKYYFSWDFWPQMVMDNFRHLVTVVALINFEFSHVRSEFFDLIQMLRNHITEAHFVSELV